MSEPGKADIEHESTNEAVDPEGLDQNGILDLGDFPIDSLMIRTESRTVFDVSRRITAGNYVMDPDFQRDFVWGVERQSKLIESALLRIPLPVFYLAETAEGKIVVVDGLQRLTTFHRFLQNEFTLRGLEFAKSLNGLRFKEMGVPLQNRIEDTQLTLYLIDSRVHETAKYEIFERVNGGVPLTRQQMRNCLYVGNATRWLGKMADSSEFLNATGRGLNPKTMRDRECINRFASFYLFDSERYHGRMDDFLSEALVLLNKQERNGLTQNFLRAMSLAHEVFGAHAFRKSLLGNSGRSVINVGLFDVFSVLFANGNSEAILNNASAIVELTQSLLRDSEFNDAISRSTNSITNVRRRFDMARHSLANFLQ